MNIRIPSSFPLPPTIIKALSATLGLFNLSAAMLGADLGLIAFMAPPAALAESAPATTPAPTAAPQLLDKHCISCHVLEKLTRYRKSREQWEQTLASMIKNDGVVLTEAEQTVLVDYFVSLKKTEAKTP